MEPGGGRAVVPPPSSRCWTRGEPAIRVRVRNRVGVHILVRIRIEIRIGIRTKCGLGLGGGESGLGPGQWNEHQVMRMQGGVMIKVRLRE